MAGVCIVAMAMVCAIATPAAARKGKDSPARKAQELATAGDKIERTGRFEEAAILFLRAYKHVPKRPQYLYRHARSLWLAGNSKAAIAALKGVVASRHTSKLLKERAQLELTQLIAQYARQRAALRARAEEAPPPIVQGGPGSAASGVVEAGKAAPARTKRPGKPVTRCPPVAKCPPAAKCPPRIKCPPVVKCPAPVKCPPCDKDTKPRTSAPEPDEPTRARKLTPGEIARTAPLRLKTPPPRAMRRPSRRAMRQPSPRARRRPPRRQVRPSVVRARPGMMPRTPAGGLSERARRSSERIRETRATQRTAATVSFVVAGLAVATGVVFAVSANGRERDLARNHLAGSDVFDLTRIAKPEAVSATNEAIARWNGAMVAGLVGLAATGTGAWLWSDDAPKTAGRTAGAGRARSR